MGKLRSIGNFVMFFFNDLLQELKEMDRKVLRLGIGAVAFILSAIFWLFFFQNTSPFGF
jgi:hypothetical protein